MNRSSTLALTLVNALWAVPAIAQTDQAGTSQEGQIRVLSRAASAAAAGAKIDYVNAKPMRLPIASAYSAEHAKLDLIQSLTSAQAPTLASARGGREAGAEGDGKQAVISLGAPAPQSVGAMPLAHGTANLPFSTARADLKPLATNDQHPYRASGKLFFLIGANTYVCSASLIKRGIVVTAAHCVSEFGQKKYFSGFEFVPGYRNGVAPYGTWKAAQVRVLDSYFQGTDSCAQTGVVCENDVAIMVLEPQTGSDGKPFYPGTSTGWFSYGWTSDASTPIGTVHVTQLGYPGCLDDGAFMQRNDAQGATSSSFSNNTVMGSLMCEGSSGGPMLINFGVAPTLTGASPALASHPNQVVGVTSWGSTNDAVKRMGASPFRSNNVKALADSACAAHPDACTSP